MSGGVDSTVAAKLLKDKGYDVSCVYFIMSDEHLKGVELASSVSSSLLLSFSVKDMRKEFNNIIEYFCKEYCDGRTPNPCVLCNPTVKFKALCDAADENGCRYIATGHYARVEQTDNTFVLRKSESLERDQSYMLYSLNQSQLSRLILPLGALQKSVVRKIALGDNLASANAPDSQEICFIPSGNYSEYINSRGVFGKKGNFISPEGKTVCPHLGVEHYTVGQRRGLGVTFGKPVFIKQILPSGDITLGYSGEEFNKSIIAINAKINPLFTLKSGDNYSVKLRSAAKPAECTIGDVSCDSFSLIFDEPQRAPALGQSAVIYDGEYLVGGGIIDRCL